MDLIQVGEEGYWNWGDAIIKDCRSSLRESLNNPILAASRGRGSLDLKFDEIPDRPGAAFVAGYGANGPLLNRSRCASRLPLRYDDVPNSLGIDWVQVHFG